MLVFDFIIQRMNEAAQMKTTKKTNRVILHHMTMSGSEYLSQGQTSLKLKINQVRGG